AQPGPGAGAAGGARDAWVDRRINGVAPAANIAAGATPFATTDPPPSAGAAAVPATRRISLLRRSSHLLLGGDVPGAWAREEGRCRNAGALGALVHFPREALTLAKI